MPTRTTILCPVDFSEPSRRALVWASTIARRRGGELIVLFVAEPLLTQAAGIRLGVDLNATETRPALRRFVEAALDAAARPPMHLVVTVGDPADVILRTARRRKAALIVMGTHGRGRIRRFLLGSTTDDVLRRAASPVLAVPASGGGSHEADAGRAGVNGILLATDFREAASAAARWAVDLSVDLDARLVVAHVVEPIVVPRRWRVVAAEADDDRAASARERLARFAGQLRAGQVSRVLSVGAPADAIAATALEQRADLVVVGRRAIGEREPHRPGDIAYRVLHMAHLPLLVVPARTTGWSAAPRPPRPVRIPDDGHTADAPRARAATP